MSFGAFDDDDNPFGQPAQGPPNHGDFNPYGAYGNPGPQGTPGPGIPEFQPQQPLALPYSQADRITEQRLLHGLNNVEQELAAAQLLPEEAASLRGQIEERLRPLLARKQQAQQSANAEAFGQAQQQRAAAMAMARSDAAFDTQGFNDRIASFTHPVSGQTAYFLRQPDGSFEPISFSSGDDLGTDRTNAIEADIGPPEPRGIIDPREDRDERLAIRRGRDGLPDIDLLSLPLALALGESQPDATPQGPVGATGLRPGEGRTVAGDDGVVRRQTYDPRYDERLRPAGQTPNTQVFTNGEFLREEVQRDAQGNMTDRQQGRWDPSAGQFAEPQGGPGGGLGDIGSTAIHPAILQELHRRAVQSVPQPQWHPDPRIRARQQLAYEEAVNQRANHFVSSYSRDRDFQARTNATVAERQRQERARADSSHRTATQEKQRADDDRRYQEIFKSLTSDPETKGLSRRERLKMAADEFFEFTGRLYGARDLTDADRTALSKAPQAAGPQSPEPPKADALKPREGDSTLAQLLAEKKRREAAKRPQAPSLTPEQKAASDDAYRRELEARGVR